MKMPRETNKKTSFSKNIEPAPESPRRKERKIYFFTLTLSSV
jgi:hypothetical protein